MKEIKEVELHLIPTPNSKRACKFFLRSRAYKAVDNEASDNNQNVEEDYDSLSIAVPYLELDRLENDIFVHEWLDIHDKHQRQYEQLVVQYKSELQKVRMSIKYDTELIRLKDKLLLLEKTIVVNPFDILRIKKGKEHLQNEILKLEEEYTRQLVDIQKAYLPLIKEKKAKIKQDKLAFNYFTSKIITDVDSNYKSKQIKVKNKK